MIELKSKQSYGTVLKNVASHGPYAIERKGQRQYILSERRRVAMYHDGVKLADFQKNSEIVKPMFKAVRCSATKFIKKHNFNVDLIEPKHSSQYANNELWDKIPVNETIYHVDAKHCYWRVAYILGYIGKGLYKKYCDNPDLKILRNVSLAIFNSSHYKEYYDSTGEKIGRIISDTSLYSRLYNNIRHYTYNNSGQVAEAIKEYCIAYRVDGIFLLKPGLRMTKKIFESNGLLYKVSKYVKVDDRNYVNEHGEIKKLF